MTRVIAAPMLMPMITMLIQLASCCCTDLEHHIVVEALADASAHKLSPETNSCVCNSLQCPILEGCASMTTTAVHAAKADSELQVAT